MIVIRSGSAAATDLEKVCKETLLSHLLDFLHLLEHIFDNFAKQRVPMYNLQASTSAGDHITQVALFLVIFWLYAFPKSTVSVFSTLLKGNVSLCLFQMGESSLRPIPRLRN